MYLGRIEDLDIKVKNEVKNSTTKLIEKYFKSDHYYLFVKVEFSNRALLLKDYLN